MLQDISDLLGELAVAVARVPVETEKQSQVKANDARFQQWPFVFKAFLFLGYMQVSLRQVFIANQ